MYYIRCIFISSCTLIFIEPVDGVVLTRETESQQLARVQIKQKKTMEL